MEGVWKVIKKEAMLRGLVPCLLQVNGGILERKHILAEHCSTLPSSKSWDDSLKKQVDKAAQQITKAAQAAYDDSSDSDVGIAEEACWRSLKTAPTYNERTCTLVKDIDFQDFSRQFIKVEQTDFTLSELDRINKIDELVHSRLEAHISGHPRLADAKRKASYVWEYVRANASCMLALKVLQGHIDVCSEVALSSMQCYMRGIDSFVEFSGEDVLHGSYLVYDTQQEAWIRSGKAININKRIKGHTKDKDKEIHKDSLLYQTYKHRWGDLGWYNSFALQVESLPIAASALYVSDRVKVKLENARFGGGKKTPRDREFEMMAYLSELVDDLLLDKRDTWCSQAPGFEGPLGVHCK